MTNAAKLTRSLISCAPRQRTSRPMLRPTHRTDATETARAQLVHIANVTLIDVYKRDMGRRVPASRGYTVASPMPLAPPVTIVTLIRSLMLPLAAPSRPSVGAAHRDSRRLPT